MAKWIGPKFCKNCGVELFERKLRHSGYCSAECGNSARAKQFFGSGNPRWIDVHVYCKQCGKEMLDKGRLGRLFCNRSCMSKWQSENLSRENSPLWQGGSSYADYPIEFNYKLRLAIRKKFDFMCQRCGKRDRSLDVHHIDGDKSNCDESNLVCLCRSCHRKEHWRITGEVNARTQAYA